MTYEHFLDEVREKLSAKGLSEVAIAHFITKHDVALNHRFDLGDSSSAAVAAVAEEAE